MKIRIEIQKELPRQTDTEPTQYNILIEGKGTYKEIETFNQYISKFPYGFIDVDGIKNYLKE